MFKRTRNASSIIRLTDGASIPNDAANADYQQFLSWQAAGNAPAPADPPSAESVAEEERVTAIDATIKADTVVASLKAMTSAEFDAWWAANVTNAAQAIAVLKRLARLALRRL